MVYKIRSFPDQENNLVNFTNPSSLSYVEMKMFQYVFNSTDKKMITLFLLTSEVLGSIGLSSILRKAGLGSY